MRKSFQKVNITDTRVSSLETALAVLTNRVLVLETTLDEWQASGAVPKKAQLKPQRPAVVGEGVTKISSTLESNREFVRPAKGIVSYMPKV